MTPPAQKPGGSKQDYATPDPFIVAVKRRLKIDSFEFDFAADVTNAKALRWYDEEHDALARDAGTWARQCDGRWGWLNPPFATIGPWARRCLETSQSGGHMAFLVPAGVGANWYRDFIHRRALVLALNGRLCFIDDWQHMIDPASVKRGAPHYFTSEPLYPKDCILCLFGPDVAPDFDVWTWKEQS